MSHKFLGNEVFRRPDLRLPSIFPSSLVAEVDYSRNIRALDFEIGKFSQPLMILQRIMNNGVTFQNFSCLSTGAISLTAALLLDDWALILATTVLASSAQSQY